MSLSSKSFRHEFILPDNRRVGATRIAPEKQDSACVYLCGNSLGACPKQSQALIQEELDVWGCLATEAHLQHPHGRPWSQVVNQVNPLMAEIVGAKPEEVCIMGTLTTNLHLMLSQFYKPTKERYKILCEVKAFPSDKYAFDSQVQNHGFDPKEAVIEIGPREGEFWIREEDILDLIEKEGSKIALVIFGGVSFYTGQWFPMKSVASAAKAQGCICGWDLAHAVGNVPLSLHEWEIDFAVWCTYKYLNSGPGGVAGIFVHEKWNGTEKPKYAGWYGQPINIRLQMGPEFSPIPGAHGFQQSSPLVLPIVSFLGSLQVFEKAGMMGPLRERSLALTGKLEALLQQSKFFVPLEEAPTRSVPGFTIITPPDPESRGAQLSLMILPRGSGVVDKVFVGLKEWGIIGGNRKPDVIRVAPAPLYNTEEDVEATAKYLDVVLASL